MSAPLRSFAVRNYRIWFAGALVSNIGTWLQRTAQDWIVIHDLTHNDAFAVGITMALQFGPQLLFIPIVGFATDHFPTRRLLMWTQAAQALIALGLGLTTLTGHATLGRVYTFALLLGIASAFDAPPRQTFVSQLVSEEYVGNAVSLNSASFNIARMVGPAVAGLLIAAVGAGWSFLLNGVSFAAVLISLFAIRESELSRPERVQRGKGELGEGFRYVRRRPDLMTVMVLILIVETFAFNFPVYIAAMCTSVFDLGSQQYGLFNSALAIGSVTGALVAAGRDRPRLRVIVLACLGLGGALAVGASMPTAATFALALPLSGLTMQLMTASANGYVQLSSAPHMRGRVMAVYMAVLGGGTPLGAPVMGWIANTLGPRASVLTGAFSAVVAALVAMTVLLMRSSFDTEIDLPGGPHLHIEVKAPAHADATVAARALEAPPVPLPVAEDPATTGGGVRVVAKH